MADQKIWNIQFVALAGIEIADRIYGREAYIVKDEVIGIVAAGKRISAECRPGSKVKGKAMSPRTLESTENCRRRAGKTIWNQ